METRRLQYFVQIVDSGSINRAATILGVAQPALSQQLAVLEAELGTRLMDRSSAGVTPTDAGRRLYVRAQGILRQVTSLKLELAEAADTVAGLVAIGLPPSLGVSLGSPLLARAMREHPKLRLQIVEDGAAALVALLEKGLLDLAISPVRVAEPSLEAEPLLQEDLFLISAAGPAPPADLPGLAKLPWIVTGSPNAIRGQLSAAFTQADLAPNIVAEINSLPLVIRAVQSGLGVTLLPRAAVAEALAAGAVQATPFGDPTPRRTVYLCARRDSVVTASVVALRRLVRAVAADLPPELGITPSGYTHQTD